MMIPTRILGLPLSIEINYRDKPEPLLRALLQQGGVKTKGSLAWLLTCGVRGGGGKVASLFLIWSEHRDLSKGWAGGVT